MTVKAAIAFAQPNPSATVLATAAKLLVRASGNASDAAEISERIGYLPRVTAILRAIATANTGDADFGSVLADVKIASDAFIESLSGRSIFATMAGDGALRRVPLGERLGGITSGSTGYIVGEGQVARGSRLTLTGATVPLLKAQAFVAVSQEVARSESPAATALVSSELSKSVTQALDTKFASIAMDSAPSFPSSGPTDQDLSDDVQALLAAVNVAGARLYFSCGANVANRLASIDKRGEMTPQGGAFLGVPAIVSGTVADGTLRLMDAASFAGDLEAVALDKSAQASLDLGDPPDSPTTASTTVISLFQSNMVAVMATVFFGAQKLRTAAAAEVTGIGNSPDSPA
jgi:hypothetical protein